MSQNYKSLLHHINTFVFDVDGVLTSTEFLVTPEGKFIKTMSSRDTIAISKAIQKGFKVLVISGGQNEGIRKKLEDLKLTKIHMGVFDKWSILENYVKSTQTELDQILYMGDESPDIECLTKVGMPCCPKDAIVEVKEVVKYISYQKGGEGCVRDVIEQTLKVQQKW